MSIHEEILNKATLQAVVSLMLVIALLAYGGLMLYKATYQLTITNEMFNQFYLLFSNIAMLAIGKWLFGKKD